MFVELLPRDKLSATLLVEALYPAASKIAGAKASEDVLVVITLLLTVKFPENVLTSIVPVDVSPEYVTLLIVIEPMIKAWLLLMDNAPKLEAEAIVDSVLLSLLKVIALFPTRAKL